MNCLKCKNSVFDLQEQTIVWKCGVSMRAPRMEPKLLLTCREARLEENRCGPLATLFKEKT